MVDDDIANDVIKVVGGDVDYDDDQTVPNGDMPMDFWRGRLTAAEADNSKTLPSEQDKERFEKARKVAEVNLLIIFIAWMVAHVAK